MLVFALISFGAGAFFFGMHFGAYLARREVKEERATLLNRIQAPDVQQRRAEYEDYEKLPTPPAPEFENDLEYNELTHG